MKRAVVVVVAAAGFLAATAFPALLARAADALTLPAGTTLHAQLTSTLSSKTNETGDRFTAEVTEPIFVGGQEVVPSGSTLDGRIALIKKPGRAKGVAEMRLTPETITTPDGSQYSISAGLEGAEGAPDAKLKDSEGTLKGPGKNKKKAAEEAGIGAGAGAGIGAIAGGGAGALEGAGIGAAAAGIHQLLKHHKDIVVPSGTELTFVLSRATTAKKVAHPTSTVVCPNCTT